MRCRYDALGDEYEASLWGIDDAEYAEREIKVEMALDVADQLEKAGYTVTGKPEPARLEPYRQAKRIRRNLARRTGQPSCHHLEQRHADHPLLQPGKHKSIEIEIPADVVAVKIPPQEGSRPWR